MLNIAGEEEGGCGRGIEGWCQRKQEISKKPKEMLEVLEEMLEVIEVVAEIWLW